MAQSLLSKPVIFTLVVTFVFVLLTCAALVLLATTLSGHPPSAICPLVIASVVIHVASAAFMIRMCCLRRLQEGSRGDTHAFETLRISQNTKAALGITILGHATTLSSFAWIMTEMPGITVAVGYSPSSMLWTLLAFWVSAIASEAAFFVTFLSHRFSRYPQESIQSVTVHNTWPSSYGSHASITAARHRSTYPHNEPRSMSRALLIFRDLRQRCSRLSLRAATTRRSKSVELLQPIRKADRPANLVGIDELPSSFGESGFDSWDTSAVSAELRRSIYQKRLKTNARNWKCRLAAVPGSRPVSPARPLDGPFYVGRDHRVVERDATLPPSPHRPCNPTSINAVPAPNKPLPEIPKAADGQPRPITRYVSFDSIKTARDHVRPLKSQMRGPQPSFGRTGSISSVGSSNGKRDSNEDGENGSFENLPAELDASEAHIHPLFRKNSPSPSPGMSANTVVTAAPVELTDIPVSIVRLSADRIRDARGYSFATSCPSNPDSPPRSPLFFSPPHSPVSPLSPYFSAFTTRVPSRPHSREASNSGLQNHSHPTRGLGKNEGSPGNVQASYPEQPPQSRLGSRLGSRQTSRTTSRAVSRTNSNDQIFSCSKAQHATLPPTSTSPKWPGHLASPAATERTRAPLPPPSPIVAVSPNGKIITKDDLAKTGNFIVCD